MPALDYKHACVEEEVSSAEVDKEVQQSRTAEVQLINTNFTSLYNLIDFFMRLTA